MSAPTVEFITDHKWRPPPAVHANGTPILDRPCEFMNCRRPREEHARPTHVRSAS